MFGVIEWIVIALIILLIFGAGWLPGIAGGLGTGIKNFLKSIKENNGNP